jgi:hypothetical protein
VGVPATLHTVTTGGGGVQGPWVVGAGSVGIPYCTSATGTRTCTPGTPVGPAAHDGRGGAPSYQVVDSLLRGGEPDAGFPYREYIADSSAGVKVTIPP